MSNFSTASNQWMTRPDEERFPDLESLQAAVNYHREIASTTLVDFADLRFDDDGDEIYVGAPGMAQHKLNHYSFQQLASQAQIHASELRKLPPRLAQTALEYRLNPAFGKRGNEQTKLLLSNPAGTDLGDLRSANGPKYGRIWDSDIVAMIRQFNADGRWVVPQPFKTAGKDNSALGPMIVDKSSTTLYASDRDVFMFLVDEDRPIELDGQSYFRGFYTWNSEVGAATFGLATFLYSYVCSNRMIWGGRDFEELRIRHSALAPQRFLELAAPRLAEFTEASDAPILETIRAAKAKRVGKDKAAVEEFLARKGFTRHQSREAISLAEQGGRSGSSGDPTNLWDLVQGGTASAREIRHQDDRLALEKHWSGLLEMVSPN